MFGNVCQKLSKSSQGLLKSSSSLRCQFMTTNRYHQICRSMASSSKVPDTPTWEHVDLTKLPELPEIDLPLLEQLERISLVELNNEVGLGQLQEAVKAANQLHTLNTEGIEPFDSVLEDRELWLRGDEVTEGNCLEEIMSNATKTEEQYFVAPPGNIALKKRDTQILEEALCKTNKESS